MILQFPAIHYLPDSWQDLNFDNIGRRSITAGQNLGLENVELIMFDVKFSP